MIDLTEPRSDGAVTLSKSKVIRDGSTQDGFLYDVEFVAAVEDESDADIIDKALRGARALYDQTRSVEKVKTELKNTTVKTTGTVGVKDPSTHAVVITGSAEIRAAHLRIGTPKGGASLLLKVRFFGLDHVAAAHFAKYTGKKVVFEWEAAQMGIPFPDAKLSKAIKILTVEDGSGGYIFGVEIARDDQKVTVEDFDDQHFPTPDDITTATIIVPPASDDDSDSDVNLNDLITDDFGKVVRAAGFVPSWKHIIIACAAVHGADAIGAYEITPEVIAIAIETAKGDPDAVIKSTPTPTQTTIDDAVSAADGADSATPDATPDTDAEQQDGGAVRDVA